MKAPDSDYSKYQVRVRLIGLLRKIHRVTTAYRGLKEGFCGETGVQLFILQAVTQ